MLIYFSVGFCLFTHCQSTSMPLGSKSICWLSRE